MKHLWSFFDRLEYFYYRLLFLRHVNSAPILHFGLLHNILPNSGPIHLPREFSSVTEINAIFHNAPKRRLEIKGFEGFALDDAVFDSKKEPWEMWSFVPLAGFLAKFAYARYKKPTVLELGCGPAHLFYFLRNFGIWDYIGIDGNPYFVKFNPYLKGYEKHFLILNLQEEIRLREGDKPLKFDIICSFEVLEHIREDKIENLIKTIRNHMHPQSVFFATASLKTEGEIDVHVLARDRQWWLKRFAKFGLYPRADEPKIVQEMLKNKPWNWESNILFALEMRR